MRALPVLLAAAALTGAACAPDGPTATSQTDPPSNRAADALGDDPGRTRGDGSADTADSGGTARFVRGLARFDGCTEFLDHVRAEAIDRVGPYGFDGYGGYAVEEQAMEEPAEEPAAEGGSFDAPTSAVSDAANDSDGGPGFTGTNVQVAGIDEPDIVKTDGRRILAISENVLSHIDIAGGAPVLTDQLQLPTGWGHELFFRDDRAFLVTNTGWGYPLPVDAIASEAGEPAATEDAEADFATGSVVADEPITPDGGSGPAAEIIEVDLTDPFDLRVVTSLQVEGHYLSARAIDDHVRLALTNGPAALPWVYPRIAGAEADAERSNRSLVESSTLADWLPDYRLTGPDGAVRTGPLLDCQRVHHPAEFAGFDMVSVLDLDLGAGLAAAADGITADAVGVLAAGQTVASSFDRFYVATTTWLPPASGDASVDDDRLVRAGEEFVTEIHAFAIAPGVPTAYVASGTVPGTLLNQFSLDEHAGDLRVVHTDGTPWDPQDLTETFLTVLREDADRLVEIGKVGGLGRGEQLYSARLMGDVGFAVTFRQIDPFYVLDLSDPTNPRVVGELKIPGFSTYLHPVGDHHVLGLGQDALESGQVTGLKLSLFDVSDPSDPREVSVWTMPDANSPAEWDHRAFQMWGSTAIVPVQSWGEDFNGVVLFDVGEVVTEIGRLRHQPRTAEPQSDCREIAADQLTADGSDLFWTAQEGRVQVCGPDDVGGWGTMYCDPIPADQIQHWFWDETARERDLAVLDLRPDDVVELCWPDGGHQEAILRSIVADGVLYTVSPSSLQGNDLATLAVVGQVPLR